MNKDNFRPISRREMFERTETKTGISKSEAFSRDNSRKIVSEKISRVKDD